jgi:hypothetical protein
VASTSGKTLGKGAATRSAEGAVRVGSIQLVKAQRHLLHQPLHAGKGDLVAVLWHEFTTGFDRDALRYWASP